MDRFSRLMDRWMAVGLIVHTVMFAGLLGAALFVSTY